MDISGRLRVSRDKDLAGAVAKVVEIGNGVISELFNDS
jgi:hypothetical protein